MVQVVDSPRKFVKPEAAPDPRVVDDLNVAPPMIPPTFTHLRERLSGIIHPWNPEMAERGDLVEGVNLDSESEQLASLSFLDSGRRAFEREVLNSGHQHDPLAAR